MIFFKQIMSSGQYSAIHKLSITRTRVYKSGLQTLAMTDIVIIITDTE